MGTTASHKAEPRPRQAKDTVRRPKPTGVRLQTQVGDEINIRDVGAAAVKAVEVGAAAVKAIEVVVVVKIAAAAMTATRERRAAAATVGTSRATAAGTRVI